MSVLRKKIFGIIGYPVAHSLSPAMHNAAFRSLRINAEYRLFPLEEKEVGPFLKNLTASAIQGLNVTVPYKEKVIPFLNSISQEARLIGAVNTIQVAAGRLKGFNTDGAGFIRHITGELRFDPCGKTVAMLGSGGVSRSIAVYLGKSKVKTLSLFDLDRKKLLALVKHLKRHFKGMNILAASSVEALDILRCDMLINATPVGMKAADPCIVDKRFLRKGLKVYDCVYNPPETKLLAEAKKKGCITANGLGMLLYQGAAAFEIWTRRRAPVKVMQAALKKGV